MTTLRQEEQSVMGGGPMVKAIGSGWVHAHQPERAPLPKKSLTRAKKPAASG